MTDQMEALDAALMAREAATHNEYRQLANGATASAAQMFREYEQNTGAMRRTAETAAARIESLRADDVMNPVGRERLLRETEDGVRKELAKRETQQLAILTVMGKHLEVAGLPPLDRTREMAARDELRMVLDGSADPAQTMQELATRGDELAAVAVGTFGESYLRARGMSPKDAQEAHGLVKTMALNAGRTSADPQVRGAANAYFGLKNLSAVTAVTRSLVWNPLGRVGVER